MLITFFLPQVRSDLIEPPRIEHTKDPKVRFFLDNCAWTWAPTVEGDGEHELTSKEVNRLDGTISEGEVIIKMSEHAKIRVSARNTQYQSGERFTHYTLEKWDSRGYAGGNGTNHWVPILQLIEDL